MTSRVPRVGPPQVRERAERAEKTVIASAFPRARNALYSNTFVSQRGSLSLKWMDEDQRDGQLAKLPLKRRGGKTNNFLGLVPTSSIATEKETSEPRTKPLVIHGMHHVGLLCEDLERSLAFYQDVLGLELNPDRPDDKLPYRGAWLWIGPEMIHLMELPNPDPLEGRPEHGGRDRHFCVGVKELSGLQERLDAAGVVYTMSKSGRKAMFFRDPDMNCLEFVEMEAWR